jgi:hypothetical protein
LLRAIALLNMSVWTLAALALSRKYTAVDPGSWWQLTLAAGYVAGCAFRSFLPVIDIPRLALVDSRLSNVLVGRSVATVAEVCFASQWSLLLHHYAQLQQSSLIAALALSIVPLIVLAEACSWYAVLTTRQRAHAAENSLWGLSAALAVVAMLMIGPHRLGALYLPMVAGGVAYVAFIFFYDVPMYWARWLSDQAHKREYLGIAAGIADCARRCTVSYRWSDWRNEVPWMSLYFTFGVWSSIWLVYASLTFGHGG